MELPRRKLLDLAASAALLPAASRLALAFDYPTRPVRLIVGFFAGGLSDILARLLSPRLSERLGQQFIVEDQPGAGTNLAAEAVVRGSRWLYASFGHVGERHQCDAIRQS